MSNGIAITYYTLMELDSESKKRISIVQNHLIQEASKGHLQGIVNAFYHSTLITSYGLPLIKVDSLGTLLRTGSSGAHRYLVDLGISGIAPAAETIIINGELYITGPSLMGLIYGRKQTTNTKQNLYLDYIIAVYNNIIRNPGVMQLKDLYLLSIEESRPTLRQARIKEKNILHCEFTGQFISNIAHVEFAHIDSVVTMPMEALNINNGVIILKNIHRELTRLKIHGIDGMYQFCQNNNYSTAWADLYIP